MPNVSFVLTNALRGGWGKYWASRPNDVPLDLVETLRSAVALTDEEAAATGLDLSDGIQLWGHPQIPFVSFLVKPSGDVEFVVIGAACHKRPTPARETPARPTPPPPEFAAIDPAMPDAGRVEALEARRKELCRWLGRVGKRNPHRGAAQMAVDELSKDIAEVNRRLAADRRERRAAEIEARKGEEPHEADHLVTNPDGKYLLVPTVRWLLDAVKELQRRVAELEAERAVLDRQPLGA